MSTSPGTAQPEFLFFLFSFLHAFFFQMLTHCPDEGGGGEGGGGRGEQTALQLALHVRISAVVSPCWWHFA